MEWESYKKNKPQTSYDKEDNLLCTKTDNGAVSFFLRLHLKILMGKGGVPAALNRLNIHSRLSLSFAFSRTVNFIIFPPSIHLHRM